VSGKSNESTYRFYQQQEHAIKQVTKKRDILLANPAILEEAFGEPLAIERTIAVVLNAMPFSLGELSEGLYVYDYSALSRFFESRYRCRRREDCGRLKGNPKRICRPRPAVAE
jgi:hypothetical protein